jgi:hypothetical protein
MVLISYLCFALAVALYALSQLQMHGKLRWSKHDDDYWGRDSGRRKYAVDYPVRTLIPAPDTFYYRIFKIRYKEKFPLSATTLSFLTDGYHLFQFIASKLIISSILTSHFAPNSLWYALVLLFTWYLVFNVVYLKFSR